MSTPDPEAVDLDYPDLDELLRSVSPPQPPQPPSSRSPAARWTPALVARGWTPISLFFLHHYSHRSIGLTHGEAMLVCHLMTYKWDARAPRPGAPAVAAQMGISASAVRKLIRSLEVKRCLKRGFRRGRPNTYDLRPLFVKLEALQNELEAQKRRRGRPLAETGPDSD